MAFFVYILFSKKLNRFYTGTTDNVAMRLEEHNKAAYPGTFTTKGRPWELYLSIPCVDSHQAYELEKFIKRMKSSAFIRKLKETPGFVEEIQKNKF